MKRVLAMVSSFGFAAAGALFGAAAPAQADIRLPQGIYTFIQEGTPIGVWTIWPVCTPTVGDLRNNLELPVACLVHVGADQYGGTYGGDARQTGGEGHWMFTQTDLQGFTCPDGIQVEARRDLRVRGHQLDRHPDHHQQRAVWCTGVDDEEVVPAGVPEAAAYSGAAIPAVL